jgi:tetratricopeptide (TPR) repeat protein
LAIADCRLETARIVPSARASEITDKRRARVRIYLALLTLILAAPLSAQAPPQDQSAPPSQQQPPSTQGQAAPAQAQLPPGPCPANFPVDEIMAEVKKEHSKRANRNKNPLPSVGCIFGVCRESGKTPPTIPQSASSAGTSSTRGEGPSPAANTTPGQSTSNSEAEQCYDRMDLAELAAHNVEVGDFQMEQKNYRAALSRYEEASQQKPADAAILVRRGRALEKLNDAPGAVEEYEAAEKLGTPDTWVHEAHASIARLNGKK